jgi:hypothetical protein
MALDSWVIKHRNRRISLLGMSWLCALGLAACATSSTDQHETHPGKSKEHELPKAIQRVPPKIMPVAEFSETRPIRLIVRSAKPGEVMSEWYESQKKVWEISSVGGAAGALAVASVPAVMGSAAILIGGVLVAAGGAMILGIEKHYQDQMVAAVAQTDLPSKIESALVRRLKIANDFTSDVPTVEVLTVTYGLIEQEQPEAVCVVAEMLLIVTVNGIERYKDSILIYPYMRSTDAPVPDCRTREVMAQNQGEVIRTSLDVFANAVPALVKNRLPGLPWQN